MFVKIIADCFLNDGFAAVKQHGDGSFVFGGFCEIAEDLKPTFWFAGVGRFPAYFQIFFGHVFVFRSASDRAVRRHSSWLSSDAFIQRMSLDSVAHRQGNGKRGLSISIPMFPCLHQVFEWIVGRIWGWGLLGGSDCD